MIKEIQEEEALLYQARKKSSRRKTKSSIGEAENDNDGPNAELRSSEASSSQQSTEPATNVNKPIQDYL